MYDQYLDFIVPSQSLFSLLPRLPSASSSPVPIATPSSKQSNPPQGSPTADPRPTYALLNDPSSTEAIIEEEIDRIAKGLFSVLATMGSVPLIRSPRGNAAEMVARKLDGKLRDALASAGRGGSGGLFSGGGGGLTGDGIGGLQRPRELPLEQVFLAHSLQ